MNLTLFLTFCMCKFFYNNSISILSNVTCHKWFCGWLHTSCWDKPGKNGVGTRGLCSISCSEVVDSRGKNDMETDYANHPRAYVLRGGISNRKVDFLLLVIDLMISMDFLTYSIGSDISLRSSFFFFSSSKGWRLILNPCYLWMMRTGELFI